MEKSNAIIVLNDSQGHSAIPKDKCIPQPSSEKLHRAIDGNKYGDSKLNNVQRVKEFTMIRSKGNVFIKLLSSELRKLCRKGSRKIVRVREGDR